MKTVGIVGGGAAGLAAAKHILSTGEMTPIIWEQSDNIGGTWAYTDSTGKDQHGLPIHSSMYKNLKTNLAKEVMGFSDYPFRCSEESFIPHTEVLKYLQDFADHFSLRKHIKIHHHVEHITPFEIKDGEPEKWTIVVTDLQTGIKSITICDFVILCNGHYSVPQMADIPGIENFKGRLVHSHSYRDPEEFQGERVVLLGGGVSGIDISLEVARCAKEVILSHHRDPLVPSEKPDNWRQSNSIVSANKDGFTLSDGEIIKVDTIMFCTGYQYTFPFLSKDCDVDVSNRQVRNLYKHIVNTSAPSMTFIGIPTLVCPFLLFDYQAGYIAQLYVGKIILPDKKTMDESIVEELRRKAATGIAERHFHKLGTNQWDYFNELTLDSKMDKVRPVIPAIFNYVHTIRNVRLLTYRQTKYTITGPDTFSSVDPLSEE